MSDTFKYPWRIKMSVLFALKLKPGCYQAMESQHLFLTVDAATLQEANSAALKKAEAFIQKEENKTFQAFVIESELLP